MGSADGHQATPDDLDVLLAALPPEIVDALRALPERASLIEVVLDLGRQPEARYPGREVTLLEREITEADIAFVVEHIGSFGDDNRAGIERTLHRISAIRNRSGKIVGLTCRIGRSVYGTIEIISDFVESGKSILIMGRPGIGKTTMLREAARVLADEQRKRVVVVDTSNEIAGDGDIPHPAIGKARRMQVRTPSLQHEVMIEAVENHMPEIIVIDEIGTELEAQAARTIAERGVQLIGTAHGNNLDNLMLNPTLSDLIGGIQSVTLGDEEARRRRSQKSVLERKQPPTFDVIVEIQDRERVLVHADVAQTVDAMLLGDVVSPELRWRDEEGVHRSQARPKPSAREGGVAGAGDRFSGLTGGGGGAGAWGREPGWRGASTYRTGGYAGEDRLPARTGFRPGSSGGWRSGRGGPERGTERGARSPEGDRPAPLSAMPGGRFAMPGERFAAAPVPGGPFVSGEIADRGPLERAEGAAAAAEVRARDARELARQLAWRAEAARALNSVKEEEGTRPVNADAIAATEEERIARMVPGEVGSTWPGDVDGAEADDDGADDDDAAFGAGSLTVEGGALLPTLRVFPHGISRKRLEQAIRDVGLPVIIAREPDEADVAMTLRSEYRQKPPALRDAEDRGIPIYVLKANTIAQMQASLASVFALEVDPREAALRETEQAIGLVIKQQEPVELAPQNAYIRRLQHQMAERANLVSRSRGREPYRRVRLYPDVARPSWR
ncbi:MAG TPA: R3H domain-containing nucleic acid-binding protein [Candidatus Limnocylindrales bacterium]|nr:R3H domain-containing nucleic acid-binding protein [Candidatus Limnocylindrales bacterium]